MRTWLEVCDFLETLPEAHQDPPGGREVVRVRGTVLAYPARNQRSRPERSSDDEEFVVVKVGWNERAALLREDPETFFVTAHYQGTPGRGIPSVIIRLTRVAPSQLRELLVAGWRLVAPRNLVLQHDPD